MQKYNFNVEQVTNECIEYIKNWFDKNGPDCNAVIGISGGKDSTIAAALCVRALGKERVIGVMLPNGEQADLADAVDVCTLLDIEHYIINIENGVNATYQELMNAGITLTRQALENVPPRERTKVIRAVCQCKNGRMINTCNLSENYIGYFTIGGDGDGDFSLLEDYTATEVIAIGHYLKLPDYLVDKTPADGLCGKTDEDNFGFTYKQLDTYIRTDKCDDAGAKEKIDMLHEKNLFKLRNKHFNYLLQK